MQAVLNAVYNQTTKVLALTLVGSAVGSARTQWFNADEIFNNVLSSSRLKLVS